MVPTEWMNSPAWLAAGSVMLHFLWVGAVIGVLATLGRTVLRGASPQVRYGFALTCFLALALAPAVIAFRVVPSSTPLALAPTLDLPLPQPMPVNEPLPFEGTGSVQSSAWELAASYLPWLWLMGAPLAFLLIATGLVGTARLRRGCEILADGEISGLCRRLAGSLGVGRTVAVGICRHIASPILVGVARPLILLPPAALTGWSMAQLEMVLLHELAHVRRWDSLVNLFQRLVEAVLFFHPAVWWLSAWVRLERELCCDAVVVQHTGRPREYAETLASFASLSPWGREQGEGALAMAEHNLVTRIRCLLKLEDRSMKISMKPVALLTAVFVGSLVGLHLYARPAPSPQDLLKPISAAESSGEIQLSQYTVRMYAVQFGDTFATICRKLYDNDRYAKALHLFNRDYPLAKAEVKADEPRLLPGEQVFYPPAEILQARYSSALAQPLAPIGDKDKSDKNSLTLRGNVAASEQANLYARISAPVDKVNADTGDKVKKGQILATLSVPEIELELKQKKALLAQAEVEVDVVRRSVEAARAAVESVRALVRVAEGELVANKAQQVIAVFELAQAENAYRLTQIPERSLQIAKSYVEKAKALEAVAAARVDAAKANALESQAKLAGIERSMYVVQAKLEVAQADLQTTQLRLQHAVILAPFDGIVVKRTLDPGSFVSPTAGKVEPLFTIARTEPALIVVYIPEASIGRVKKGTAVSVQVDAYPNQKFEGKIARMAPTIDPRVGAVRAEIELTTTGARLIPGMTANAVIPLE